MSGREWKPGDVARVRFAWGMGEYYTCLRQERNGRLGWAYSKHGRSDWTADDHPAGPTDVRPLVVIDPESPDDLERLAAAWNSQTHADLGPERMSLGAYRMQAALREFANPKPPKPDEPQGLGAVVEDAAGRPWVRASADQPSWRQEDDGWRDYADIKAVRVLSEGVQP